MTEDQARKLATRIIDTWPNGPRAYIWRDSLLKLEPQRAADVYRHMADTADTITVGRFKAEYDRRIRADRQPDTGIRWTGNEIGLDEYLTRLQRRATDGEAEAIDEMGNWERWLATKEQP